MLQALTDQCGMCDCPRGATIMIGALPRHTPPSWRDGAAATGRGPTSASRAGPSPSSAPRPRSPTQATPSSTTQDGKEARRTLILPFASQRRRTPSCRRRSLQRNAPECKPYLRHEDKRQEGLGQRKTNSTNVPKVSAPPENCNSECRTQWSHR